MHGKLAAIPAPRLQGKELISGRVPRGRAMADNLLN